MGINAHAKHWVLVSLGIKPSRSAKKLRWLLSSNTFLGAISQKQKGLHFWHIMMSSEEWRRDPNVLEVLALHCKLPNNFRFKNKILDAEIYHEDCALFYWKLRASRIIWFMIKRSLYSQSEFKKKCWLSIEILNIDFSSGF